MISEIEGRLRSYRNQHLKYGHIPVFDSFQNMIDLELLLSRLREYEEVVDVAKKLYATNITPPINRLILSNELREALNKLTDEQGE